MPTYTEDWPEAVSFRLGLEATNRSPRTVETYMDSIRTLHGFLAAAGPVPELPRVSATHIRAFIVDQLKRNSDATAHLRYRSLVRFFSFLVDEEELQKNPMTRVQPPRVTPKEIPVLSVDQIRRLIATCSSKKIEDVRDEAIIRLLADTGIRKSELLALTVDDVDLEKREMRVFGKGRKYRTVALSSKTAISVDRYLRARRRLAVHAMPNLWLARHKPLAASGFVTMLRRRGAEAGIEGLHPHQLRHSFAHHWLSNGGNEGDLMKLAGWTTREMLNRYGAAAAEERARAAHQRLAIGNQL